MLTVARLRIALLAAGAAALACSAPTAPAAGSDRAAPAAAAAAPTATDAVIHAAISAPVRVDERELIVLDAATLRGWDADARTPLSLFAVLRRLQEARGLAVPEAPAGSATGADLAALDATYGEVARTLSSDIDRLVGDLAVDWEDDVTRTYLPSAARTPAGRRLRRTGDVARTLRARWLTSPDGRWLLAGVVFRPDRRDLAPAGCGELRVVYRLGYGIASADDFFASRLPATLSAVFRIASDGRGCRTIAAPWTDVERLELAQLELNAQVVRFPSGLEHGEGRGFAGQAIYLMRVFRMADGRLRPAPLENTPDVAAIAADPGKQRALAAYIGAHLADIDDGVFQLPAELLADVALSYSTHGSARRANRPFDALLTPAQATALVAAGAEPRRFVVDGPALLERLNGATCSGCHQSSSVAGFHLLGEDRADLGDPARAAAALDGNRLRVPVSPHLAAELVRRGRYLSDLRSGRAPDRFRPHPSAPAAVDGPAAAGVNMPCPLGQALGSAATWSCAEGLTCQPLVEAGGSFQLGSCVPPAPAMTAGLACRAVAIAETATVATGTLAFNTGAFRDRVVRDQPLYPQAPAGPRAQSCRPPRIGVPLGRLSRRCRADEKALAGFAAGAPAEICAIVGGKGFETMAMGVFSGRRFARAVVRGLLDTCTPDRACREDYICQAMPAFLADGGVSPDILSRLERDRVGFCTPTYFVYQLRLDGHPDPR